MARTGINSRDLIARLNRSGFPSEAELGCLVKQRISEREALIAQIRQTPSYPKTAEPIPPLEAPQVREDEAKQFAAMMILLQLRQGTAHIIIAGDPTGRLTLEVRAIFAMGDTNIHRCLELLISGYFGKHEIL